MGFDTILVNEENKVITITLNRPQIRNAFNGLMILELKAVFKRITGQGEARAVVLTGAGDSFCAGADLRWMKKVMDYSFEENLEDSMHLAVLLESIYTCPLPVIGRINGHAIGGGTGLVAVCDIAIGVENAKFAFTETKLGLAPAVISPYLLKRMGERNIRELFITGSVFSAESAREFGLLNRCVRPDQLDAKVTEVVNCILSSGPQAILAAKKLAISQPSNDLKLESRKNAEIISRLRMSEEGQEGMKAFLEKRSPEWVDD